MKPGPSPLVSIVTLNWNQTKITCEFLESTRNLNYKNYEVLVCDMNSDENPVDIIAAHDYPNTRVLRSDKNLGFAGGNNWGMHQAKGEYIFIVNNDTEVTPDLLNILLESFSENSLVGVVCPKIRFFHQPDIIQYAGFNPINVYTGRTSAIGNKEPDAGQHDVSRYTAGAHGCAMMIRRSVLEEVGMFPEKFFLYYEEWDLSTRILKAGYKILYQGQALIYHKESVSVGKQNAMKVYYHTRNRILYMRRQAGLFQFLCFAVFFLLVAMPNSVFQYLRKGQYGHLKHFFKGVLWHITASKYSAVS